MMRRDSPRPLSVRTQALWNMRWPAVYLCGPVAGLLLIDLFFGLPGKLWLLAAGFFIFSLMLFGILLRGETQRLRRMTPHR